MYWPLIKKFRWYPIERSCILLETKKPNKILPNGGRNCWKTTNEKSVNGRKAEENEQVHKIIQRILTTLLSNIVRPECSLKTKHRILQV